MPRRRSALEGFLLHVHPRLVPAEALRFGRTLGAGGVALVLLALAAASGGLLLAGYEPSPERAHASVARLASGVPFGALTRSVHVLAADGALAVAFGHMLRVLFQGAWLSPRRGNWEVGVGLLALLAAAAFTGRLLPWDQAGYWAVHTGTALLGQLPLVGGPLLRLLRAGDEVGARTLALYFGLHVAALPFALLGLLTLHFWLVRKAGGVVLPQGRPASQARPASPDLTVRERAAALMTTATVLLLAAVGGAPAPEAANPGMSPDPARAPWYLAGLQELLLHAHPAAAAAAPLAGLAAAAALPLLAGVERASGRWFLSPRGARWAIAAALGGAATAAFLVGCGEAARAGVAPPEASWAAALPLPALAVLSSRSSPRPAGSRLEALQAAATFALTALLVLTFVGAVLRGPGMSLGWPVPVASPPAVRP